MGGYRQVVTQDALATIVKTMLDPPDEVIGIPFPKFVVSEIAKPTGIWRPSSICKKCPRGLLFFLLFHEGKLRAGERAAQRRAARGAPAARHAAGPEAHRAPHGLPQGAHQIRLEPSQAGPAAAQEPGKHTGPSPPSLWIHLAVDLSLQAASWTLPKRIVSDALRA